ncbi:MAG TPA: helix-turn-helix domain-containing protein [Gammaproteobacteria bacterium]
MNRLDIKQRAQILHMLVEGNSLRATARMADVSRNTVDKLLRDVGAACLDYQEKALRNLPCKRVQCDEIWSFVHTKERNLPEQERGRFGVGDVWTWTAICADTKLVPCWHVGNRGVEDARLFIDDLAGRLANRVQLTTDGHTPYLTAVEDALGADIDYAILIKIYGQTAEGQRRYSPPVCVGCDEHKVTGKPNKDHISTSYVERQNLTMRMSMRRFTRLTNAFSKKVENHMHAISLHYMYYNFGRIHRLLRVTPAMEAGISDHVWSLEEIAALADSN